MLALIGLFGIIVAYLLGSLPSGFIAGRMLKGIDMRTQGSGSTGATNVLRVLGPWPALIVFLIDVAKGAAAVLVMHWLLTRPQVVAESPALLPWMVSLAGLVAILGHSWPVWLNFKGGKSVATGLGVLLALAWPVALAGLAVFAVLLALFRMVSLGSMLAAVTAIGLILWLDQPWPYRLLVIAAGVYVIARHHANIGRILSGTEPRLGRASLQSKPN